MPISEPIARELTGMFLHNTAFAIYNAIKDAHRKEDRYYSFFASPSGSGIDLIQRLWLNTGDKEQFTVTIRINQRPDGSWWAECVINDMDTHTSMRKVVDGIRNVIKEKQEAYDKVTKERRNGMYTAIGALGYKGIPTNVIRNMIVPYAPQPAAAAGDKIKGLLNRVAKGGSRRRRSHRRKTRKSVK